MFSLVLQRSVSSNVGEFVFNRNPRSLEKLRIAFKPKGWHLEKPGKSFWHKLTFERTSRHLTSRLVHFKNGTVLTASTKEWAIRKFLYSTVDKSAYMNLGRVMSQRCLQCGITEMINDNLEVKSDNLKLFYEEMEKNGISFQEPDAYVNPRPSDIERPEKSWEIHI
ncbi:39S ribosomal protein L18, mitochondrial [Cimex lectularius]|uniref:Large ribosomal subunit protein uL18m n=1 Tax=Cimex lectularius TaxID=79782 RepID=A0A8I6S5G3_CIMLE|nr:39S ribosomal protein L18, mitochondrial [Cimex lectularius]